MESKSSAKNKSNFRGISRKMRVKDKGTRKEKEGRILHREDYSSGGAGTTCAHRWLIENNIAENVDFFNLNALASTVAVKVDFDVAMTLIANTLYKILSSKFKLFKNSKPKTTRRVFIGGRAAGEITNDEVRIEFKKRSFNPMLMDWISYLAKINVPWVGNRNLSLYFEK